MTARGGIRYLRPDGPGGGFMGFTPDQMEQIGFLAIDVDGPAGVEKRFVGSCFFMSLDDPGRGQTFGYLITARHVHTALDGERAYVRLNKFQQEPNSSGVTYEPLPDGWVFHENPAVDLAVLPWHLRQNGNYQCTSMVYTEIASAEAYIRERGGVWPPQPGDPVFHIGTLLQHHGTDRNFPIVRSGCFASATTEEVEGPCGWSHYYLIDLHTYPLHSGGPVWAKYADLLFLLGIMSGGFPEPIEVLKSSGMTHEYLSLGISLVTPVEKLQEILMGDELRSMREAAKQRPVGRKVIPTGAAQSEESFTRDDFERALKKVAKKQPDSETTQTSGD